MEERSGRSIHVVQYDYILCLQKEAELKQLQGQLEERPGKGSDLKQMAKAVRQEMLSPQLAVENKLMVNNPLPLVSLFPTAAVATGKISCEMNFQ